MTYNMNIQVLVRSLVAIFLAVVIVAPGVAFADGANTVKIQTGNVWGGPSTSAPSAPTTGTRFVSQPAANYSVKPAYKPTYNYNSGSCNGNYNCNNYSSGWGGYAYTPRYNYGYSGYGGGTIFAFGYNRGDRTNIVNNNTNTNTNINGGYVPRHRYVYDDRDDDRDDDYDRPRCELDASDTSIDRGDSTTLEWSTTGDVDDASINNGIGDVDEDGDERVRPRRDTTYRMTVEGPGGSSSCSVTIRVDDEDNGGVTLLSEPTDNTLTSVTLSDLPYTGTEDVIIWTSIIASLLALMGGAGYFFMKKGIPTLATSSVVTPVLPQVNTMQSVATAQATSAVKVPSTLDVQGFVRALLDQDQVLAAEILEEEIANGVDAKFFMVRAKNAIQGVLDNRTRGGYADQKVVDMTEGVSNEDLALIVSTLGEAIIARA